MSTCEHLLLCGGLARRRGRKPEEREGGEAGRGRERQGAPAVTVIDTCSGEGALIDSHRSLTCSQMSADCNVIKNSVRRGGGGGGVRRQACHHRGSAKGRVG